MGKIGTAPDSQFEEMGTGTRFPPDSQFKKIFKEIEKSSCIELATKVI